MNAGLMMKSKKIHVSMYISEFNQLPLLLKFEKNMDVEKLAEIFLGMVRDIF